MKGKRLLLIAVVTAGLATGCSKFKLDETGILVEKNGRIKSVIKESLDKSYYDETELKSMIDDTVNSYNTKMGTEQVEIEKYQVKDREATLEILYDSFDDYQEMNRVKFYQGDLSGVQGTIYELQGTFFQVSKGKVQDTVDASTVMATSNYNVVVLEEDILVQVPGNIVFISSNMELLGENKARAKGKESVQTEMEQAQTGEAGIPVLHPEETEDTPVKESTDLFYIIYE